MTAPVRNASNGQFPGRVIAVHGSVIDVRFPARGLNRGMQPHLPGSGQDAPGKGDLDQGFAARDRQPPIQRAERGRKAARRPITCCAGTEAP